ncbi:MAG TPA: amino acid adenylation domain-containing protein, partial [Steroidobacteraceae bacterium]|nr:amino acid adenylation domain-containing protein [Steroidobacteraceae bacterium]
MSEPTLKSLETETSVLQRKIEGLSPKRRELLQKLMQQSGIENAKSTDEAPLPKVSRSAPHFPLSSAQERLWFLEQLGDTRGAFNVHMALRLKQYFNPEVLRRAVYALVQRHEPLRTGYLKVDGEPRQFVAEARPYYETHDLSSSPPEDRAALIQLHIDAHRKHRFDLEAGRPFAVALLTVSNTEQLLLFTLHHLAIDGTSHGLLLGELLTLYGSFASGGSDTCLPALGLQYIDYASWQRDRLHAHDGQLAYWKKELAGSEFFLDLPTDFTRPDRMEYGGGSISFKVPADKLARIRARARQLNCSLFMCCLAAFSVVLAKRSGRSDFIIGTDVANRNRPEIRDLVGFFVNQLALRCRWDGDLSLRELVERIRQICLRAYQNQEVPFNYLLDQLKVSRSGAHTPLFQVKLAFDNSTGEAQEDAVLEPVEQTIDTAEFDLEAAMREVAGTLQGRFRYRTALFAPRTVEGMRDDFLAILELIAERPETRLSAIEPPSARDQEMHGPVLPVDLSLIDSLLSAPDVSTTAVEFAGRSWTYAELKHAVEILAAYLLDRGVGPGSVIAIGLPRGFDVLVAHLAAMRVGACYVPIDMNQGLERIGYVLENCGARNIITTEAMRALLPDRGVNEIVIESDWLTKFARPIPAVWPQTCGAQLAYILYTSGSSGKPKGVAVGLHSLTNFLVAMLPVTGIASTDKLLAVTTTAFDISGLELYLPLLAKATLAIATSVEVQDSRLLWNRLSLDGITILQATPATWRGLCSVARAGRLPKLRAFCGGEAFPADLVASLNQLCESVHNMYGPTETTIWSSTARLDGPLERGATAAPLGAPILNTSFYVLDADGNRLPAGAHGQLCIAGEGLAIGYLGRPALTANAFIPDAWSGRPGGRLYLTGDVASLSHQGALNFIGRRDHQVKIRGYRIELGEIESVLRAHPAVDSVAAVTATGVDGESSICAFVTASEKCSTGHPIGSELLEYASRHLPAYMVPTTITWLDALPLTANGKIDRGGLQRQASERKPDAESVGTPPATEQECRVAELWRELLALDHVFLEQDFFKCGGHSLLAVKLLDRIETTMERRVSLQRFFDEPTLAGLVKALSDSPSAAQKSTNLVPDPQARYEPFPLSDLQEAYLIGRRSDLMPGGIATQNYMEFDVQDLDIDRFADCWNALVERHDMLRAVFDRSGRQRVLPKVARYVPGYADLSALAKEEKSKVLQSTRETMSRTALPESSGPLFALRISRLESRLYRLHFCIDMLISDALSNGTLLSELHSLYEDRDAALAPLDVTFRDYMIADRRLRASGDYSRARDYWVGRLDSFPDAPKLPLASASASPKGSFVRRRLTLDEAAWSAVKRQAGLNGVSPTVALLTVFSQVLATWGSSKHFALNLTMFNRRGVHEQVNRIVGDFTSSMLLEVKVDSDLSFVDRALQLQNRLWQDMDHASFSGVSVMRELNRRRGGSTPVAMPVVFTSVLGMESHAGQQSAPNVDSQSLDSEDDESFGISQTAQIWLDHQVAEVAGSLNIMWDAIDDLFPTGVLDAMLAAYSRVLESLALDTGWNTTLNVIPIEQLVVRERVNARHADVDTALLHELFERSADRFSASEAIVAGEKRITYGELETWTNALAAQVRAVNDSLSPVAIVMDKSWEQIVAALAILKSGAPYLPIDASLPAKRIEALIRDGGCRVVLVRSGQLARDEQHGHRIIEVSADALSKVNVPRALQTRSCSEIAYIIYTSGSTGEPKGVVIDHRGAVNTVLDINRRFGITAKDRVLAVSSLSFDLSVYDIFGVLAAGGAIVIPCGTQVTDAGSWRRLIEQERITVWNSVPALMQLVVEQCEALGSKALASLKVAMLSGDWVPVDLPERITQLAQQCRVVSLGGATEASIWSIFHPVTDPVGHLPSVPYGTPLTNQSFQVLDDRLEPCPDWV